MISNDMKCYLTLPNNAAFYTNTLLVGTTEPTAIKLTVPINSKTYSCKLPNTLMDSTNV